jgi:hypothetical protein
MDRRHSVRNDEPPMVSGPFARLIEEIGKAAGAGWAQTVRLIMLLIVAGAAVAVIIAASR